MASPISQGITIARFAHKLVESYCSIHGTTVAASQGKGISIRHSGVTLWIPVARGMSPEQIGGRITHWIQEVCPVYMAEGNAPKAIDKPK